MLLGFVSGIQAQEDWKQIREKEGITVFTRSNPDMDFKEFRSSMIVDGTLDQFLSVLYDIEGLSSWGYNVKRASLVSRESDTLQVYYAEAKAPFPYKKSGRCLSQYFQMGSW